MDNGYLIASVAVAAISIVIPRRRNRITLQRDERDDRFQRTQVDSGQDHEDTLTAISWTFKGDVDCPIPDVNSYSTFVTSLNRSAKHGEAAK
jgi:hypothetical protein